MLSSLWKTPTCRIDKLIPPEGSSGFPDACSLPLLPGKRVNQHENEERTLVTHPIFFPSAMTTIQGHFFSRDESGGRFTSQAGLLFLTGLFSSIGLEFESFALGCLIP